MPWVSVRVSPLSDHSRLDGGTESRRTWHWGSFLWRLRQPSRFEICHRLFACRCVALVIDRRRKPHRGDRSELWLIGSGLENLQAVEKVPKPVSSRSGFLKAILALNALYGVSDVVLSAHADEIRMAIIFELNDGIP
jgi:hypothetical protein